MSSCAPPRITAFPARIRRYRLFLLAVLGLGVWALPGRGDVIILKDGFTIHGKVSDEKTQFFDPLTGASIVTRKMKSLTIVDDGPRFTIFSANYKRVGDVSNFDKFQDDVSIKRPAFRKSSVRLPPYMQLKEKTDFNEFWQRTLTFSTPNGLEKIVEQIITLTPHYTQTVSTTHTWSSSFLTRELGSVRVRKLLAAHPDFDEKKGGPDVEKRAKIVRFLIQADWLAEAEEEVERLQKDLPAETKRADDLRHEIRDIRLEWLITDIERALESGRHSYALSALKQIPKTNVPAKLTLKVAGLKAKYDASTEKLTKAKHYLTELKEQVAKASGYKDLCAAVDFILAELHLDTTSRLDFFIALAEQAESATKSGKPPMQTPEVLLAAAINGWLMGNTSTETNVDTARKRLKAREMALDYLRNISGIKRKQLLQTYEQGADALPFDEMDKLISLLPPPEAEKDIPKGPTQKNTGSVPGLPPGVNYLLQLPPEYQHGRAYPLLLVLPNGGKRLTETLQALGNLPSIHGYIVAVVDWNENGVKNSYTYTEAEQNTVTALLRHLRRTLQVDSDRVFLFGLGEGATMALDPGAMHPDKFAGIVPMCPSPDPRLFKPFAYWMNFQNLPLYMIIGDQAGESVKIIRDMLENWMPKGYPVVAVSYKGRGFEWYGEELPYVFDWMGRKMRSMATPDLGRAKEEYRTVRATANRFYWVSFDEIDPRCLWDPTVRGRTVNPAWIQANLVEGNKISINSFGVRQVSIWIGKGMSDFAKPVVVRINGHEKLFKELKPRISVLLEDLYERGDRQRPFYQRIDCQDLHKLVKFSAQ